LASVRSPASSGDHQARKNGRPKPTSSTDLWGLAGKGHVTWSGAERTRRHRRRWQIQQAGKPLVPDQKA